MAKSKLRPDGTRECKGCVLKGRPALKPWTEEHFHRHSIYGLQHRCKVCMRERRQATACEDKRLKVNRQRYEKLLREDRVASAGNGVLMLQAWANS